MKPTFLTKKQREELALQRLQEKRQEEEKRQKEAEEAHKNFITGKSLEEKRKQEQLRKEQEEKERQHREKEENKESEEREHEINSIREHYLGGAEKKRKIVLPSEKFTRIFKFEWNETDDTGLNDANPLYNNRMHINALYGRGYLAGIDQREQRKESNYLLQLGEKRMREALKMEDDGKTLTEEEKKARARARDRAAEEFKQKQIAEYRAAEMRDRHANEKHWTEKTLAEMGERDWRIFREDFDIRIQGGRATLPIRNWAEAGFPQEINKAIETAGYEKPSPIQRQAIPIGMANRDIIGIAETGSGKTAAFVIPMICYLLKMPKHYLERCHDQGPLAIIMAPTRELAQQIETECIKLAKYTGLKTVSIVGGQSIEEQGYALRLGAHIVVGTPGRMIDCLDHSYMVLNQCNYVVLDEADRMVEMGFEEQVVAVLETMGGLLKSADESQAEQQIQSAQSNSTILYRVTAMFSATMPTEVEQIAKKFLRHPVIVRIGDEDTGKNKRIEQRIFYISEGQKKQKLMEILNSLSKTVDKVIVFINQKKIGDTLTNQLQNSGFEVGILHGGKSQDQREETLDMFRDGSIQILVATDVAGRGLDIPDVTNVINYDCPNKIENYCHRIGRTGRAGKYGIASTFVTDADTEVMYDLKSYLESTGAAIPQQLASHPAAKAPVGTRDERGNLVGEKRQTIQFAKK